MTDVEHFFHVRISHLFILFVTCSSFGLLTFFILICTSSLCILDASPLCQIYVFMNIFSQSVTYVFILLIVSFDD